MVLIVIETCYSLHCPRVMYVQIFWDKQPSTAAKDARRILGVCMCAEAYEKSVPNLTILVKVYFTFPFKMFLNVYRSVLVILFQPKTCRLSSVFFFFKETYSFRTGTGFILHTYRSLKRSSFQNHDFFFPTKWISVFISISELFSVEECYICQGCNMLGSLCLRALWSRPL